MSETTEQIEETQDMAENQALQEKIEDLNRKEAMSADKFMILLMWLHFPAIIVLSYEHGTYLIGIISSILTLGLASLAYFLLRGKVLLSILNGILLICLSAIVIQVQLGRIEMHFHLFTSLTFLLLYREWKSIVAASGTAAVHHVIFNYLQLGGVTIAGSPIMVFNYGAGWDVIILHTAFITFECALLIFMARSLKQQVVDQLTSVAKLEAVQDHSDEVITNMSKTSVEMVVSAEELVNAAAGVAANSQDQAASLEEMSASIEEVTASVDNVATITNGQSDNLTSLVDLMQDLVKATTSMTTQVEESNELVRETSSHAKLGEESLNVMNTSMENIGESSNKMMDIVTIINDIADKINLLSLNASIEAARAGEAGRGFAIVAEEVSKLADQTASSISDINGLVKLSDEEVKTGQNNVQSGTNTIIKIINDINAISQTIDNLHHSMQKQLGIFNMVHTKINEVNDTSTTIKNYTDEQKVAINEINQAITNVNNVTQSNVDSADTLAINAEMNNAAAETLKNKIENLLEESAGL